MRKMIRALPIVIILSIITTTAALGTALQREDALTSLERIERIAYVGMAGWIGMPDAAHPSLLFRLLDDNPHNDNNLGGRSMALLNELDALETIIQSLDPEEDFELLEQESKNETGFTFSERLVILEDKLAQILELLPESGINSPKRKARIIAMIEISIEMTHQLTNTLNTVCADFSELAEGESVEGFETVAPYLSISTDTGGAVKIIEGGEITAYGSPNDLCGVIGPINIHNNLIAAGGGFSDMTAVGEDLPQNFTFTFNGVTIRSFSLHMWDFGDWNPTAATNHRIEMFALDGDGSSVATQVLQYTTPQEKTPRESSEPNYGNLHCNTGDASTEEGYPGNWVWVVSGEELLRSRSLSRKVTIPTSASIRCASFLSRNLSRKSRIESLAAHSGGLCLHYQEQQVPGQRG